MAQRDNEGQHTDSGFTLIELAVVILIIGILISFAMVSYLGVKKNAQFKSAQSSARTAFIHAKAYYGALDSFQGVTVSVLNAAETTSTFVATASTGPQVVSFEVTGVRYDVFTAAVYSPAGRCYYGQEGADGVLRKFFVDMSTNTACVADTTNFAAAALVNNPW